MLTDSRNRARQRPSPVSVTYRETSIAIYRARVCRRQISEPGRGMRFPSPLKQVFAVPGTALIRAFRTAEYSLNTDSQTEKKPNPMAAWITR